MVSANVICININITKCTRVHLSDVALNVALRKKLCGALSAKGRINNIIHMTPCLR